MEFIKSLIGSIFIGVFICFLVNHEISKYGLPRGISLGFGLIIMNMYFIHFKK